MKECVACNLISGEKHLPGGRLFATQYWVVEHCIGPFGIGTLIVKPIRHCLHFWDLKDIEVTEVGPLLKKSSSVIKQITDCDQVYFCMWSHANWKSGHIHFVLQPSWNRYQDRYTGPGPLLQIEMIKERNIPSEADVEEFCNKARELYA